MIFVEVTDTRTKKDFLELPVKIYKNDDQWIRPLDKDIEAVFDKSKNKFFRQGEAIRWVLYDGKKPVGRIAAFYNRKTGKGFEQPTGGIGFFETVNDKETIKMLPLHYLTRVRNGCLQKAWKQWMDQSTLARRTDGGGCWLMGLQSLYIA
jgi:hypothetical protein